MLGPTRILDAVILLAAISAAPSCARQAEETTSERVVSTTLPFAERFVLVATISPRQDSDVLVARLADLEMSASGLIYVLDSSEGNAKVYNLSGDLEGVIGRKGHGPGEFVQPWRIELDGAGRAHILDLSLNRITIFDAIDDNQPTVIQIQGMSGVQDFALLSDGRYVVVDRWGSEPGVIALIDRHGNIQSRHLPGLRSLTPDGEPDGPEWDYPRVFFARERSDTVFVTSSLTNRIWMLDTVSGATSERAVSFDSYDAPRLPGTNDPARSSGPLMMAWFLKFHLNGYHVPYASGLLWPFIRGEYYSGGDVTLLHHDAERNAWEILTEPPVVVAAVGDTIIATRNIDSDDMQILVYHRRGEN